MHAKHFLRLRRGVAPLRLKRQGLDNLDMFDAPRAGCDRGGLPDVRRDVLAPRQVDVAGDGDPNAILYRAVLALEYEDDGLGSKTCANEPLAHCTAESCVLRFCGFMLPRRAANTARNCTHTHTSTTILLVTSRSGEMVRTNTK
jgi:hypothetical protein